MRCVKHLFLIMVFLCALPIAALAQVGGSIDGTITDPNGAVVPGANVTATQTATGYTITVQTTQAGVYNFPLLPTGPYSLTVKQSGFKTFVRAGIEVRVGLTETINMQLELGTVQQEVEVKGVAPLLETANATRGTGLSPQTMDTLPLFNNGLRLANAFVGYMPAVNSNGETSIEGSTGRGSEVMIDGGSMVNPESGGVVFYFPGMEAYSEFKLVTSGFTAENGRVGGGIQEFTSKSGTNQFHGSAFFNFQRQFFDAVPWATNANPAARDAAPCIVPQAKACRPKTRYNDEGGSAGGPIYIPHVYDGRNKSFFYFTFEGFWQPAAVTVNGSESTPTAAMLQGNFAGLTNAAGPEIIYDPATTGLNGNAPGVRSAFAGNIIPTARFSTIASKIIPFIPAPNVGNSVNPSGNYTYNSTNLVTDKDWSIKIDHTIRTNHHIAFFYTHRINQTTTDQYFPGPLSNGLRSPNAPKQLRLSHDWVVNPHVVLHSFYSMSTDNQTWFTDLQTGYGCKFGFNNLPCGTVSDVTPVISFQTDLTVPSGEGNADGAAPLTCSTCLTWGMDQGKVNNGGQLNWTNMGGQTLSWVRNKHEFKMGWDLRKMRTFGHDLATTNGTYLFNADQTAQSTATTGTSGNSFASFLLGDVNQAGAGSLPVTFSGIRYQYLAGFFQDTWRVKPRLTVDLGMRYEVPIGWHMYNGQYSSFSPTIVDPTAGNLPGGLIFMGSGPGRIGANRPYPTDFQDVGPRAGFAYQLGSKTVIRGSFGIFYEALGNGGCGCTDGINGSFTQPGDGFDPTFQWDGNGTTGSAGVHPPLGFNPPPLTNPGFDNFNSGLYMMGPHYGKAPRIYEYNMTVQRQYKNWLFEIAYAGNRAHGLSSSEYINTVPDNKIYLANLPAALTQNGVTVPAGTNLLSYSFNNPAQATVLNALGYYAPSGVGAFGYTAGNPCPGWSACWSAGWSGNATLGQSLRPYPQYGTIYSANSGDGWIAYDSLQTKAEHRFGDLNMEGTFVWSKTLDMMAYRQIFTQCCVEQTQDAQNIPDSKTLDNSDYPFVLNFTTSYQLPFGRGKHFLGNSGGVLNELVGGWTAAALGQYRSGALIEITSPSNLLATPYIGEPLTKAIFTGAAIKTHVATNSLDPNNPNIRWFTTTSAGTSASFTQTPAGTLGNASIYNTNFRQPWYRYEAISLNKNIGIYGENRVYLRYTLDVYNPFNRTGFAGIQGNITNANFGRPTAAYDAARVITMGLRLYF
jgi:hypothetical protein